MMRNYVRNSVAIVVGIVLLCVPLIIIRASFEISLIGDMPAIEQLRADMTKITGTALEDAIGQATIWNQKIQTLRAYDDCFWAAPFIPDDWSRVALLPMPKGVESGPAVAKVEKLGSEIIQLRTELARLTQKVENNYPITMRNTEEP